MSFTIVTPEASTHPDPGLGAAIARVHVAGWKEAYGHLLPPHFYDDAVLRRRSAHWTAMLSRPEACSSTRLALRTDSLCEEAGSTAPADFASSTDVIGFASVGPARDDDRTGLELWALYILREQYGSGVGQALLDAALGTQPATLWVAEDNPRARRFYARNGFAPDGARKVDADLNDLAEIRMTR